MLHERSGPLSLQFSDEVRPWPSKSAIPLPGELILTEAQQARALGDMPAEGRAQPRWVSDWRRPVWSDRVHDHGQSRLRTRSGADGGQLRVGIFNSSTGGTTTANNKYAQQSISSTWTSTDNDGQTYVWRVRYGLNEAAAGHMPAGFVYAEYQPTGGSDWHAKLRTDVTTYRMPMAAGVAPHDPGAFYWLTSWPTPNQAGHYIVLSGWYAYWDGTRGPTVNYNDGSGGYGGSTGTYSDPASDVYYTITKSNPVHAPNWVIW